MRIPDNTIYYSRLSTYGTQGLALDEIADLPGCPRLYKAKYVDHTYTETASPFAAYGGLIHDALFIAEEEGLPILPDALDKAFARMHEDLTLGPEQYAEAVADLEKYLERNQPEIATVAVEQHLRMPLMEIDGEQYWAAGYIDKVSVDPSDPLTLIVDDYKTNRAPESQANVDKNNQLTLYACLVRANLDRFAPGVDPRDVSIRVAWDGIKWYRLESLRSHWEMDQFEDWMRVVVRKIVADEAGDPILNENCDWCPIRFDCPAFRKLPGDGKTLADRMSTTTDLTQRVHLMQHAELTVKALKNGVIDPVKAELLQQAKENGDITINGVTYYADEAWQTLIDMQEVFSILGENQFLNIASVTQKALTDLAKGDPVLKDKLDATMQRVPKEGKQLKSKKAE